MAVGQFMRDEDGMSFVVTQALNLEVIQTEYNMTRDGSIILEVRRRLHVSMFCWCSAY